MQTGTLVLNVAYLVLVSATFTRRILWLRGALVVSAALFVAFGLLTENWTMVFWNALAGLLHGRQAHRYIRSQRGLDLSPAEAAIRAAWFPDVDSFDFQTLWTMGETNDYHLTALASEGEAQTSLMLILEGSAVVDVGGDEVGIVKSGDLVGEMSFISGAPANATVTCQDTVRVREWDQERLRALDHLNPSAASALRGRIQDNLAQKLIDRSS